MTPQEAAKLVDWPNPNRVQEIPGFVLAASARDLQLFVHSIQTNTTDAKEWRERAGMALGIRLAEDAEQTARKIVTGTDALVQQSENLSRQTDGLIGQVAALVIISGEQKNYAAKLERQTNKLIALSWGLVIFSFVLLIVALIQTRIMFKENPETHVQQIQTGQSQ